MRERDTEKQKRILAAAGQIVMTEGIAAVSLSKIAKAAGIASGTLYTYFKDKDDMLKALYLHHKTAMAQATITFDPDGDPEQELVNYMALVYAYAQHHLADMLLIREFNQSPVLQQLGIDRAQAYAGYEPIMRLTERGVAAGVFMPVVFNVLMSYAYTPVVEYAVAVANGMIDPQQVPFERIQMLSCRAILVHPRA
ncbi:MAG: TetR/AcrR family transcriptional regulator [Lactobacillus sp.]|jgi:AcrR family transcriptional regulator|nr:TetR/AcrR family transcriptional regulator [Lactobacillus sp.]MCI2031955.1 TetR/AcrR family transcriptional regulator [Lactobacillus sp.]